jgi:hypothetical protein
MADGVKNYNQETWRIIIGEQGKSMLCKYAQDVHTFYMTQLTSENHQVREACCLAISELYLRIAPDFNREAFRGQPALSFTDQLSNSLIHEPYYGVRVQAITALAAILAVYQEDLKEEQVKEVTERWFSRLAENVGTVRESAAIAIVANAHKLGLKERVREYIKANLMKAKE